MKVSDLIAQWLAEKGIRHVFTVSGGADLHIIHSIWARDDIEIVCPQNEQSASFMADCYARLNGLGCALATSGPGATNLITGIAASYYDSVPVLYITGNQTRERMKNHGTRQYGFQAMPFVELVKPITKYAATIVDVDCVAHDLNKALSIANSGRKGPVVIDIPDDVQRASI